ncbi:MAG: BtaA family protein [Candidatus Thiodiazotropha sp. 6PLUC9]
MTPKPAISDRFHQKIFSSLYQRSLVYNTCWEDPAVDRDALRIGSDDRMLVITSAGCNVLDYALCAPSHIDAVDANPRQTALLELKLSTIRHLDFDDFFSFFGEGTHRHASEAYYDALRADLSPFARDYWDKRIKWFDPKGSSFFYYGLSGLVARAFSRYLKMRPKLRSGIHSLYEASDIDDQRERYDAAVAPFLWSRGVNWAISRPITMSLLGVPHPQREEVVRSHANGIAGFVRDAIDYVFRMLPVGDNYFWAVYIHGKYTRDCCPEYLKPENFMALKNGLADRISPHTCTVTEFLQQHDEKISRFVLLDHMDWMSAYYPQALVEEWQAIMARATPEARLIFRSAHHTPEYLEKLELPGHGRLTNLLGFEKNLAKELNLRDRVHTYAGFHIAHMNA